MTSLPGVVRRKIDEILLRDENIKKIYSSSCSKEGGPGESWLILTGSRLIIGNQTLTSDIELSEIPFEKITGIEKDGRGFGCGALHFISGQEKIDQFSYTSLESDLFLQADHEILQAIKKAGIRPKAASLPLSPKEPSLSPPRPPALPGAEPPKAPESPRRPRAPQPIRKAPLPSPDPEGSATGQAVLEAEAPAPPPVRQRKALPDAPSALFRATGTGSSRLQVFLPPEPYAPGQIIPGQIQLRVGRGGSLSARGIRFQVLGVETASVIRSGGRTSTTFTEQRPLLEEETVLFGEPSRPLFDNLSEAFEYLTGAKIAKAFPGGTHNWNINLALPEAAPPSFRGKHGKVAYMLKAYVDIPLGFDIVKTVNLNVLSGPGTYEFSRDNRERRENSPLGFVLGAQDSFVMKVQVHPLQWGEGRSIRGRLSFQNLGERLVRGIQIRSYFVEEAWPKGAHARRVFGKKQAYKRIDFNGRQFPETTFAIPVPEGPQPFACRFFKVDLVLEVALDLSLSSDFRLRFIAKRT